WTPRGVCRKTGGPDGTEHSISAQAHGWPTVGPAAYGSGLCWLDALVRLLRLREHLANPAGFVRRGAKEDKAHLVRRLFAEADCLGRVERVIGVRRAVVVDGIDVEPRARLDAEGLIEEVGFLPVVVPLRDYQQRLGSTVRRGHRHLDLFADHVHVRHDRV